MQLSEVQNFALRFTRPTERRILQETLKLLPLWSCILNQLLAPLLQYPSGRNICKRCPGYNSKMAQSVPWPILVLVFDPRKQIILYKIRFLQINFLLLVQSPYRIWSPKRYFTFIWNTCKYFGPGHRDKEKYFLPSSQYM